MKSEKPKIARKTPIQARSKETVNAILTATAQVLAKNGLARSDTNRIAERAGVSIGSLYQYFPNKESIIASLIERHTIQLLTEIKLKLVSPKKSITEAIAAFVSAAIESHSDDAPMHGVLAAQGKISDQFELKSQEENEIAALLQDYFQNQSENFRPPDAELSALIIVQTVKSLVHHAALNKKNDEQMKELKTEITEMLVRYLTF